MPQCRRLVESTGLRQRADRADRMGEASEGIARDLARPPKGGGAPHPTTGEEIAHRLGPVGVRRIVAQVPERAPVGDESRRDGGLRVVGLLDSAEVRLAQAGHGGVEPEKVPRLARLLNAV